MNAHLAASFHFPVVPVAGFVLGALGVRFIPKASPWWEVARAVLWGGAFAAFFASTGACQ